METKKNIIENGGNMPQTTINNDELISVIEKRVNPNGQIYIGREYKDKIVRAYIVSVKGPDTSACPK